MAKEAEAVFSASMTAQERKAAGALAEKWIQDVRTLSDLRKARALTQAALAEKLGVGQENVSRLERRSDMLLSTLRSYVEAMGGSLTLTVVFPGGEPVELSALSQLDEETG